MDVEPLRIRAWLRTGVVTDGALPLDGILLFQAMRHTYGPQAATLPGQVSARQAWIPMPLQRLHPDTPDWYYACSFAVWPEHTREGKAYWEKRFQTRHDDLLDLGRTTRIIIEKGRYRSYHMPVFYLTALHIDWYAVGERRGVLALLRDVWAIGKKTAQGWGRVLRWEVTPWAEDWSVYRAGRLQRAVPAAHLPAFHPGALQLTGFRPPYWARENQTLCAVPGDPGEEGNPDERR